MSVPAYKRHLSPMAYIAETQELLRMTLRNCIKASKRFYKYGLEQTFAMAQNIMNYTIKANMCHVNTEYEKRTEYLKEALRELACLSNHLQLLILFIDLPDNKWLAWGKQITTCETLIKGIMNSDKRRQ